MKGQYFSFDAIIASVIFVLALVALLSYWHSVRAFLDYQNDPLGKEAIRVSNLFFLPSSPTDDCNTMTRFGLAAGIDDKRVSSVVLGCAKGKDEAWLQRTLGTGYGVSLRVTNVSDSHYVTIGGDVPTSPAPVNVVRMRRLATVVNPDDTTYLVMVDLSMYR